MKRLLALLTLLFSLLALATQSLPAFAADRLESVVPLAKDDLAAVAQIKAKPGHHVLLYFGDHLN